MSTYHLHVFSSLNVRLSMFILFYCPTFNFLSRFFGSSVHLVSPIIQSMCKVWTWTVSVFWFLPAFITLLALRIPIRRIVPEGTPSMTLGWNMNMIWHVLCTNGYVCYVCDELCYVMYVMLCYVCDVMLCQRLLEIRWTDGAWYPSCCHDLYLGHDGLASRLRLNS